MSEATVRQAASEVSIAKAAQEIRYAEKARLFPGRGRIELGGPFAREAIASHFHAVGISGTIRSFRMKDVVLDADTLLLFDDGAVLPETSYFVPPDQYAQAHVRQDALVRVDDDAIFVIGYNLMHWSYLHWLTQCIPAIDWSVREQRSDRLRLVLPLLEPWQEEMLALLGYEAIPRLLPRAGTQYMLPRAEYNQFLNGSGSFNVCLSLVSTCQRMLASVGSRPSSRSVIYVPCENPYYGRFANEAELIELLEKRDVYIVRRDEMSLAERINLFHHADVVIGPHCEGLTDVLFCRPSTLLWELMPGHHRNAVYNRLAQAGELDYWADAFGSAEPRPGREWSADLDVVTDRLRAISRRLAHQDDDRRWTRLAERAPTAVSQPAKPLDELMLEFESLGDNCEFGLIQRKGGAEPLGLLRFAGILAPYEQRLERLITALEAEFAGLGALDTVKLDLQGEPGRREFLVRETAYDLQYHTFMHEGEIEPEELRRRETVRLTFLRRKLLEDLREGGKIWVWKSVPTTSIEQIQPLLDVLRRFGANTLLWVVPAGDGDESGTVQRLADDLIKGYIEWFPPTMAPGDVPPYTWFQVCQNAYDLLHPTAAAAALPPTETAATALTGIAYLQQNPASFGAPAAPPPRRGLLARLAQWFSYGRGQ